MRISVVLLSRCDRYRSCLYDRMSELGHKPTKVKRHEPSMFLVATWAREKSNDDQ